MGKPEMTAGDSVIYRVTKYSTKPGPRAKNVEPAPNGDSYRYQVDKFWVVTDVLPDGKLEVATRRGKKRVVDSSDFRLRKARWWERILLGSRFPTRAAN